MDEQTPPQRSPHVLDLSDSFAEVKGSVQTLRGTVSEVTGIVLRPEESPIQSRMDSAEAKPEQAVSAPAFQPYAAAYHGAERAVRTPQDEAQVRRIEADNERRFRSDPTVLLRNFAGQPDPFVTANRLASEQEVRPQA